jgi:hypothetical protein
MALMPDNVAVSAVWYEQGTRTHEERGLASVRLVTNVGDYSRTVPLSRESFAETWRMARRIGASLVVAHELRSVVGDW